MRNLHLLQVREGEPGSTQDRVAQEIEDGKWQFCLVVWEVARGVAMSGAGLVWGRVGVSAPSLIRAILSLTSLAEIGLLNQFS